MYSILLVSLSLFYWDIFGNRSPAFDTRTTIAICALQAVWLTIAEDWIAAFKLRFLRFIFFLKLRCGACNSLLCSISCIYRSNGLNLCNYSCSCRHNCRQSGFDIFFPPVLIPEASPSLCKQPEPEPPSVFLPFLPPFPFNLFLFSFLFLFLFSGALSLFSCRHGTRP